MPTDPRRVRPSELCRLLNSTPLGEVISERQLRSHRIRAGLRIGDDRYLDLVRYVAWLVHLRHAPKTASPVSGEPVLVDLAEAALGAAAIVNARNRTERGAEKLSQRQQGLIAALLTEPTYTAATAKAQVGKSSL